MNGGNLPAKIKRWRKVAGFNKQYAIARELGWSERTYQRVEAGEKQPSLEELDQIIELVSGRFERAGRVEEARLFESDIRSASLLPTGWSPEVTEQATLLLERLQEGIGSLRSSLLHAAPEYRPLIQGALNGFSERYTERTRPWGEPKPWTEEGLNALQIVAGLASAVKWPEGTSEMKAVVRELERLFRSPAAPTDDHYKMVQWYSGLRQGDSAICFSYVPPDWWLGEGGRRYSDANVAASIRSVKTARLVTCRDEDELDTLRPVLLAQHKAGIDIRVLVGHKSRELPEFDHGVFTIGNRHVIGLIPEQPDGQRSGVIFIPSQPSTSPASALLKIDQHIWRSGVALEEARSTSWFRT